MVEQLVPLAMGFGAAFLGWLVFVVFDKVPTENRQYLDKPPIGFRLIWPLIRLLEYYGGSVILGAYRSELTTRLKKAGAEYRITVEQFFAAKIVSSFIMCVLACSVLILYGSAAALVCLMLAVLAFWYPDLWLKEQAKVRSAAILKELPFYLDVITLAVESGSNLTGGITQTVRNTSETVLRREFSRVLRDIRSGKRRDQALRDLGDRTDNAGLKSVVSSLIQAEKTGASLGPILRAQSNQLRTQRFQLAEKKAMEAPVKMLGPLVLFIFPTTSLVIVFVLLSKAIQERLLTWAPLVWAYGWPG